MWILWVSSKVICYMEFKFPQEGLYHCLMVSTVFKWSHFWLSCHLPTTSSCSHSSSHLYTRVGSKTTDPRVPKFDTVGFSKTSVWEHSGFTVADPVTKGDLSGGGHLICKMSKLAALYCKHTFLMLHKDKIVLCPHYPFCHRSCLFHLDGDIALSYLKKQP